MATLRVSSSTGRKEFNHRLLCYWFRRYRSPLTKLYMGYMFGHLKKQRWICNGLVHIPIMSILPSGGFAKPTVAVPMGILPSEAVPMDIIRFIYQYREYQFD